jgi:hypothetical protein
MSCLFLIACTVRPATRAVGLHPIGALHERSLFSRSADCSSFLSMVTKIPGLHTIFMKPRLFCTPMQLRMHTAKLPAQWFTVIRDQVPSVIGYLPGYIMRPSKSTTRKILHAFYNAGICSQQCVMYISYNILLCLPCRGT